MRSPEALQGTLQVQDMTSAASRRPHSPQLGCAPGPRRTSASVPLQVRLQCRLVFRLTPRHDGLRDD